jgi:TnpA family transposase
MLRVAGSLPTSQVRACDLLRMFGRDGHPTPLGQAFMEYGRIAKTLHQLAALGLVLNAVVLWNTRCLDAIVESLRGSGQPVRDEAAARLSPLGHAHLNCLGRYAFTAQLPAELRPLRDPNARDGEDDGEF